MPKGERSSRTSSRIGWKESASEQELSLNIITGHGISGPFFLTRTLKLPSRFPKLTEDGPREWGRRRAQEEEEIQEGKG